MENLKLIAASGLQRLLPVLLFTFGGCSIRTEALYTFVVQTEKHLINAERGKFLLLDEGTSCLTFHESITENAKLSAAPPAALEDRLVLHIDRDVCGYYDGNATRVSTVLAIDNLPPVTTMAFVGYDEGATAPTLTACINGTHTTSERFDLATGSGFDPDEPARYESFEARCAR